MNKDDHNFRVSSARKIYELLNAIHRTPEFWLTSKSITSLQNFLNGYMTLGFADDIYHNGEPNFDEFKYWILNKGKRNTEVGNPFSTVLLAECNGDEVRAFEIFFEYLNEFGKEINS